MFKRKRMKIAVFPGSFDPITKGHVDIAERASGFFDKVIVSIGINENKNYLFSLEQRRDWLKEVFKHNPKIEISEYNGLTAKYCQEVGAGYMIRGLRNAADFDYEKTISQLNNIIGDGVETVFLISKPEFSHISSTIVREIIKGKGDVSAFVPEAITAKL